MEHPPARRRRWPWIVLATLAALVVALRIALPYGLARAAERAARDTLGLPLEIANVDLGLLRGRLAVEGVALGRTGTPAREAPLLELGRLAARISWLELLGGRVELHEVALERPVVRLSRLEDGSIENPLPDRPQEPPEPASEDEEAGWPIAVSELRVADLDFELADPGREAPAVGFSLAELSLREVALAGEDLTLGGVGIRGPRLRVERSFVFGAGDAAPPAPAAAPPTAHAPPAEPAGPTPAPPASADPAPAAVAPSDPAQATSTPPAPPTTETPAPAGGGTRYRLESLAIENADISLLTNDGPIDLSLDLAAQGVSARAGETFPVAVGLRVGGGELRAEGRAGLAPPSYEGTLRWSALPIPLSVLALRPDLVPWLDSCDSDGELQVTARLAAGPEAPGPPGAKISGTVDLHDLAIGDPDGNELEIRWSALEVRIRELDVPLAGDEPIQVALAELTLRDPQIRYARPTPALDELLGGEPANVEVGATPGEEAEPRPEPAAEEEPSEGTPLELEIDRLSVSGGTLSFADRTLDEAYRGAVTKLSVDARDVRWPALRAKGVEVRGVAPDQAPFSLAGNLEGMRGAFDFELQRLPLPPLDPYVSQAGYRFARGDASLRTRLVLDPERYATENDLLLHDLRLDSADPGSFERQFGTSLDFALALLRDPSGDIRLPVPVVVERENLRLGLGRIVLGALRAALVGVVSSPLKALGAALPGGGQEDVDLASLPAEPGRPEISAGAAKLEVLAELLRTRPLLALEATGRSGAGDAAALAEQIAIERASAGESLPDIEGSGFLSRRRVAEALRAEGRGETPELSEEDRALRDRTVAAVPVPPERFEALARARAEALRGRLTSDYGVPAERVRVAENFAEGEPGVAIELAARVGEVVGDEAPSSVSAPAP